MSSTNLLPCPANRSYSSGLDRRCPMAAVPATIVRGLPPKVPPANTLSCSSWCFCHSNLLHDVGAARDGPYRQSASQGLPVRGEIGYDAELLLGPAICQAEPGDHLVEEEQDTCFPAGGRQLAKEVPAFERGVGTLHRLDEHYGQPVAVLPDEVEGGLVPVGQHQHILDRGVGYAPSHGNRSGPVSRASVLCLNQYGIVGPVIGTLEHRDPRLGSVGPRNPDAVHRGLGTGVAEHHQIRRKGPPHGTTRPSGSW